MRFRDSAVVLLALTAIAGAPLYALAEPPPSGDAASGTVPPVREPAGQVVTLTGPFDSPVTSRRSVTPASRSVSTAARKRNAVARVSEPSIRARGGPSERVVAAAAARGGRSALVFGASSSALPVVTPKAVMPAGGDVKRHGAADWSLPLLIAVGALELLIVLRFAYRRWARRRSVRRAAENFAEMPAESVPREASYARYRATKR